MKSLQSVPTWSGMKDPGSIQNMAFTKWTGPLLLQDIPFNYSLMQKQERRA